jgi:hypothetical protein
MWLHIGLFLGGKNFMENLKTFSICNADYGDGATVYEIKIKDGEIYSASISSEEVHNIENKPNWKVTQLVLEKFKENKYELEKLAKELYEYSVGYALLKNICQNQITIISRQIPKIGLEIKYWQDLMKK